MEKITFKNKTHEINYRIQMNLIPAQLRANKEIQSAIYFISLVETQSAGVSEDIFRFVKHSLPVGFFDNPETDKVAKELALRFFDASYLVLEEEWNSYFLEAMSLDLFSILGRNKIDFNVYLLSQFKNMIQKL